MSEPFEFCPHCGESRKKANPLCRDMAGNIWPPSPSWLCGTGYETPDSPTSTCLKNKQINDLNKALKDLSHLVGAFVSDGYILTDDREGLKVSEAPELATWLSKDK